MGFSKNKLKCNFLILEEFQTQGTYQGWVSGNKYDRKTLVLAHLQCLYYPSTNWKLIYIHVIKTKPYDSSVFESAFYIHYLIFILATSLRTIHDGYYYQPHFSENIRSLLTYARSHSYWYNQSQTQAFWYHE